MSISRRWAAWRNAWQALTAWQKIGVCALAGYSAAHLAYSAYQYNPFTFASAGGDFRATFQGALDWRRTGSFAMTGLPSASVYYPPLFYLLLLPWTVFPWTVAAYSFYLLQYLPLGYAAVLLVRTAAGRRRPTPAEYLIGLILTVNFQPFLATLAQYKIEGWEFFFICLAFEAYRKRRDMLAGAGIALAAHLKYLPGVLVLHFLLKREGRVLLGIAVACLAVFLLLLPILGPESLWTFVVEHPRDLLLNRRIEFNRFDACPERQTLGGTIYRWFSVVTPPNTFEHHLRIGIFPISHPRLAHALAQGLKVLVFGWYVWFLWRRRWTVAERTARWPLILYELSLTLLMIFVITQGARMHYAILVLPAFVLTGLLLYQHRARFRWPEKVLFAAAYSLSGWLIPGGLLDRLPPSPVWGRAHADFYLWLSLPFYGFVLLGVCIVLCYRRVLEWQRWDRDQTRRPR